MKIEVKIILFFIIFLCTIQPVYAKRVRLVPNHPIQKQFDRGPAKYVVRSSIDLCGQSIKVPDGSSILFRGGCIFNGKMSGAFYVKGAKKGSLNVVLNKGSRLLSEFHVYNQTPAINASILAACRVGAFLEEDVVINSDVNLHCSLDGQDHILSADSTVAAVIRMTNMKDITIKSIIIHRDYSREINKNYALICRNSSNVTVKDSFVEGRLYFVNNTFSDDMSDISSGIVIKNCDLSCDISSCPQGWQYGQDHIAFYSIKDILMSNNRITSVGVNRVLKTSQYFSNNDYSSVLHCTDNVSFEGNTVIAKSDYGKQMWDMFCGSTNILIQGNSFDIDGFTRFVENKAYQDKYANGELVTSYIRILNNSVCASFADLFQFRASPRCDQFEIRNNTFIMKGPNKNLNTGFVRNCGGYLQGYKRLVLSNNTFRWEDDANGLLFLKVNFSCGDTIIENNYFEDVYRINLGEATHSIRGRQKAEGHSFIYKGNVKKYSNAFTNSREELYLAGSNLEDVVIEIMENDFNNSYEAIITKDVRIEKMEYSSLAVNSRSYSIH